MYLLDTNVLSETSRPLRMNPGVRAWLESVPASALHFSVVTDLELERGALLQERKDALRAVSLRRWLVSLRRSMDTRLLDLTPEIARICAAIQVPDRRPLADALIAATALHHGLIMVTRNERDFDVPGLRVLNPFSDA